MYAEFGDWCWKTVPATTFVEFQRIPYKMLSDVITAHQRNALKKPENADRIVFLWGGPKKKP